MTTLIQLTQSLLFHNASLLAQVEYSTEGKPPSPLSMIVGLLIALLLIVAMWKVFTKAGQPGWDSIIPIYNLYIWCKIVGRPGWWILLMLIPFVNIIVGIILCIDMAKSFGKGAGFGIGLALLGVIFIPILGFGSAQYQGPSASAGGAVAPPPQPARASGFSTSCARPNNFGWSGNRLPAIVVGTAPIFVPPELNSCRI